MKTKTVEIREDFIKLSQLLKFAGAVSSGSEAGEIIRNGQVKVNGAVCEMRGKKIVVGDKVQLPNGEELLVIKKQ